MQSARDVRGFASELNVAEVHVAFSGDIITFCLLGIFSHYYPIVPRSMSLCYMSCITAPVPIICIPYSLYYIVFRV